MQVWINGQFVERDSARVSAFDAGFQHAVGLFETMLAKDGTVFRGLAHMERLAKSARELRLSEKLRIEPLVDAIEMTVQRNEFDEARVRLSVTGGDLNLLQSRGAAVHDPTILIVAQPPTPYPDHFFTDGVAVTVADGRSNPFESTAGHKSMNYWTRILALQQAAMKQAGEALWFTVSNHLAGGSVSNAFLVKDGTLSTPIARGEESEGAIPAGVLPGITRSAIIELAEAEGTPIDRRMLTIEDVLAADEVFLTNSSWGVLPVVTLERETIGTGEVGPTTASLRASWLTLVDEETSA